MLIVGVCIILGIAGVSWLVGSQLVAPCQRTIGNLPGDLIGEAVSFYTGSWVRIAGWYVPGKPGHGVLMLLHGVRGSRLDMLSRARFLNHDGFSVLLFDFQGHGESGGGTISFGYHEADAVDAAIDYVKLRAPGERIGAVACSMGAASLVLAKDSNRLQAVVLESMYPTIVNAVEDRIAHRLGNWGRVLTVLLTCQLRPRLGFDADQLRPIEAVAGLHMPKLFIAGAADPLTTLAESESIYGHASDPKALWIVPGAGHVDLHATVGAEYETRILGFLHGTMLRPLTMVPLAHETIPAN